MTNAVNAQNLLNDIPTIVKVDRDTCRSWGFNRDSNNDPNHDWVDISYLRYGASLCNDFYTKFYYDIKAQSNDNNYLQMIINSPLIKDSIYEIGFVIDPRFNRKKWARGRSLNLAFLNEIFDTLTNIQLKMMQPVNSISATTLLDNEFVNYRFNYKATGHEKCFLLFGKSNNKEDVLFTIKDICLHKKHTSCENFNKQYNDEKENKSVLNDTIKLYFDIDASILKEDNMLVLKDLALDKDAEYHVFCIGYADTTGNKNYNLNLSLQRALNVQDYLRSLYPNLKINVSAKGAVTDKNNLSLNRKVEVIIVK